MGSLEEESKGLRPICCDLGNAYVPRATFIKSMDNLLDSTKLVIAIVRWRDEGYPLTVKQRSDIDLRELTLDNRDEVFQEVVEWIGDRSERLNSTCNA